MAEEKISLKVVKLALLGDSAVGKTALCHALLNLDFSEDALASIGIDKLETKFPLKNGKEIKLILWDTAGQERFSSMAMQTLRAVQGIVVVFDVTAKRTFENVNLWLEDIKECIDNPCLVLFGNKADMPNEKWEVTKEEAEQYAKKMNLQYFETSAKTKQGLDEGFSFIVNKAYDTAKAQQGIIIDGDEQKKEEYEYVNGCFGKKKKKKKKNKDKDGSKDKEKVKDKSKKK